MPYKPKFCCQCGEKIERVDWKLLTSRRFCELCATEFGVYDKLPLAVVAISVLFGLFGFGSYWRAGEKTPSAAPNQFVASAPGANKSETNRAVQPQVLSNTSVPTTAQTSSPAKTETVQPPQSLKTKTSETPAQEIVYFCGAMTKKGTPCSRRVKNGGRCWQHMGQPAMLPQEQLIVKK
ncbi:MAG TPA: hypothetical protein VGC76_18710 [Pyrinomonadaceae bacterium]|jgi:hypothetical protein